jgi:hypothetical protein
MRLGAAESTAENNVIRVSAEGVYAAISAVGKTGIFVAPIAFA